MAACFGITVPAKPTIYLSTHARSRRRSSISGRLGVEIRRQPPRFPPDPRRPGPGSNPLLSSWTVSPVSKAGTVTPKYRSRTRRVSFATAYVKRPKETPRQRRPIDGFSGSVTPDTRSPGRLFPECRPRHRGDRSVNVRLDCALPNIPKCDFDHCCWKKTTPWRRAGSLVPSSRSMPRSEFQDPGAGSFPSGNSPTNPASANPNCSPERDVITIGDRDMWQRARRT